MADHVRYEQMAVGHVLGGLDEVDSAAFRAHLLGCSHCRRRVNELRDIASDLAATEREERRSTARGDVEVETLTGQDRDDAPGATEVAPMRRWPWGVVVIGLVPLLVLGTLAWAVWQRVQTDLSAAVAESQQQVLEVLATGEHVQWTSVEAIDGNVATDGELVAVNLAGLPDLRPDEGLVVWLLDEQGTSVAQTRPYLPSQLGGSLVAVMRQPSTAREFVVSIETDLTTLQRPTGYRLLAGPLPQDVDPS